MTREAVEALLARRNAAWKARDASALASLHAASGVVVSPTGGVLEGRTEIERVYRVWFSAFPDLMTQPDALIDGDRAVEILHFSGTHAGEFFGLPATGNRIEYTGVSVWEFDGGKARRGWIFTDVATLMAQLGVA